MRFAGSGWRMEFFSEEFVREVLDVVVQMVELAGALIIAVGAAIAIVRFVTTAFRHHHNGDAFVPIRLSLGRFLALGLEFQLAGDIIRTAIAPSWEEIGQLAAIAAIRTALNYFLAREIKEEREQLRAADQDEMAHPVR